MKHMFLIGFLFSCCQPGSDIDPGDPNDCEAACDVMKKYACDGHDGNPGPDEIPNTEDDQTCEQVCRDIVETGMVELNQDCVKNAISCEEVEQCITD